jgi:hypothetical protein
MRAAVARWSRAPGSWAWPWAAREDRRHGLPHPRRELVDQREIEARLGVHGGGQVLASPS